jgi:hypothetical protein
MYGNLTPVLMTNTAMKSARAHIGCLFLMVVVALVAGSPEITWAADIGWPEAVSRLAEQRSKAETCVAVLKGHGNTARIERGSLDYATVKGDFDAVIAGLITVLAEGGAPQTLPSLETEMQQGASGLSEFCKAVAALLPSASGQKGIVGDIVKATVGPTIKMLSDAVSTLYQDHREDNALTRQTIETQLEATKWPDFADVPAVRE